MSPPITTVSMGGKPVTRSFFAQQLVNRTGADRCEEHTHRVNPSIALGRLPRRAGAK
jgi:hypothetical protein